MGGLHNLVVSVVTNLQLDERPPCLDDMDWQQHYRRWSFAGVWGHA